MTSRNAASFKLAAATLDAARDTLRARAEAGEIEPREALAQFQAVRERLIAECKAAQAAQAKIKAARKSLVLAVVRAWSEGAEWRDEGDAIEALITGGYLEIADISCEEALEALATK